MKTTLPSIPTHIYFDYNSQLVNQMINSYHISSPHDNFNITPVPVTYSLLCFLTFTEIPLKYGSYDRKLLLETKYFFSYFNFSTGSCLKLLKFFFLFLSSFIDITLQSFPLIIIMLSSLYYLSFFFTFKYHCIILMIKNQFFVFLSAKL